MTTTILQRTDPLTAYADLPDAERVLDLARLRQELGRDVEPLRRRVKPAASVMISHADPAGGMSPAAIGWTLLVASADKREGVLRRAARSGADVTELPRTAGAPYLLSGGLAADPRLGRAVDAVLRRHDPAGLRVLSYNPARHLVLELTGTREVLRIAASSLTPLSRLSTAWLERGLPTLAQRPWRDRPSILVGEHWGEGDLAAHADHPGAEQAAAAAGRAVARLHSAPPTDQEGLPSARIGAQISSTLAAAAAVLPHLAHRVDDLARQLRDRLPRGGEQTLIHGDLSPDQVLVDPSRIAGKDGIRIIDLDRSGPGPLGADLGTWTAGCLAAGTEHLAAAFLRGYADHAPLPEREHLAAWTARALLAGMLDPMRHCAEDWPEALAARLALAGAVLADPDRIPAPAPSAPMIPPEVLVAGIRWSVRRAWPDDGRGVPLELEHHGDLRGARLHPAAGGLTVLEPGTDPRLPGLARTLVELPGGVVVSHRVGKRAVVRTADGRYVKIVRRGRTARILAAIERAAAFDGPFRTPAVLGHDEETIAFSALPGTTLHHPLPIADGTWRRAWADTLDAWTEACSRSARTRTDGPPAPSDVHGPQREIEVLTTWRDRAAAIDPAGAAERERTVAAARHLLEELPQPPRVALIHRDLHDKQVLWEPGGRPGLLDVDTATEGDPAVDLANLRAHARWRELQGAWTPAHARILREEIDRAGARAQIPPTTVAAYEAATTVRLTCVYAFRSQWRDAVRTLSADLRGNAGGTAVDASRAGAAPIRTDPSRARWPGTHRRGTAPADERNTTS